MPQQEVLLTVALAGTAFVSTSTDNFLLLIGFFAQPGCSRTQVIAGYLAAVAGVLMAAKGLSLVSELAVANYLGWLGMVPLGLGIYQFTQIFRKPAADAGVAPAPDGRAKWPAVGLVMLANSGDTLAVLTAFLADTQPELDWIVILTVLAVAAAGGGLAMRLVAIDFLQPLFAAFSRFVLPFLLMGIGVYILLNSPTDTLA
ncbi:cadmium resistance transporter [Gloeobacter morelensis]|uniref:Cadmium resistance transporter n=1 Tax=Gloeobacter morelensis MG652769 TaxID=2781736 RepID=A0ABY3PRQ4_9CYAN|nr:cadmium resistance transporter [Gloeobacter morelensis]UFP96282.1 cadmium resistance transporter [Gloeobacter morelensis MG652769]